MDTTFQKYDKEVYDKEFAEELYQVLETPVSIKLIKVLNHKERLLLEYKLKALKYYTELEKFDTDEQNEYDSLINIIKSVLNNGRKRLSQRVYYGTGQYNQLTKK